MRLWSLHPQYLDPQGLVALWREALLARSVLRGETKGYRHHPQLDRFRQQDAPVSAANAYLKIVHTEAVRRGYAFDAGKIGRQQQIVAIPVNAGQIDFEWAHLMSKLALRNPSLHEKWHTLAAPKCNPIFRRKAGGIEAWERGEMPFPPTLYKPRARN